MSETPFPPVIDLALASYGCAIRDLVRFQANWRRRRADDAAKRAKDDLRARVGTLVQACELVEKYFDLPDKTGFTPEQAYALGAVKGALLAVYGKVQR